MADDLDTTPTCVDLDVLAAERFRCQPLGCTLSVLSCAKQHVTAKVARKLRPDEWHGAYGSPCKRCLVGEENARRARL
jgi:hypothetical protein